MKFATKIIIGVCVVIAVVLFFSLSGSSSTKYDFFAQCVSAKGLAMYGAYWCPHCQDQKSLFGASFKYINYTECSLPNEAGETSQCQADGIQSYPTWQMPDGTKRPGELSLQEISVITGCTLPN